jgi:membrane associated rhomboid family serine protease
MVPDPRCPNCAGKVSATAAWCMHCGADIEHPVDAESGAPIERRATVGNARESDETTTGATVVGVALAILAALTLPLVAPPDALLLVLATAVGVGVGAARQSTPTAAVRTGGKSLAAAPFAIWFVWGLLNGLGNVEPQALFGAIVYALVVVSVTRAVE